jgi:hypothetical protein
MSQSVYLLLNRFSVCTRCRRGLQGVIYHHSMSDPSGNLYRYRFEGFWNYGLTATDVVPIDFAEMSQSVKSLKPFGSSSLRSEADCVTGLPRSSETAPLWDPTVGLCPGPYGDPRGMGVVCARYPCIPIQTTSSPLTFSWWASNDRVAGAPATRILCEKSLNLKSISQGDFGHFRGNNLIILSKVAKIAVKIVFKLKLFPYKIVPGMVTSSPDFRVVQGHLAYKKHPPSLGPP